MWSVLGVLVSGNFHFVPILQILSDSLIIPILCMSHTPCSGSSFVLETELMVGNCNKSYTDMGKDDLISGGRFTSYCGESAVLSVSSLERAEAPALHPPSDRRASCETEAMYWMCLYLRGPFVG